MKIQDFPIWANWDKVPEDKKILIDLIDCKRDCIDIVVLLSLAKVAGSVLGKPTSTRVTASLLKANMNDVSLVGVFKVVL